MTHAADAGPDFRRRPRGLPVFIAILVLAVAASLAVKVATRPGPPCQSSFVPAFFPPSDWSRAAHGGTGPPVMILNPASGPGTAADPAFRAAAGQARGAGSGVIGYIGTQYGQRPLAAVEQDIRRYRDWYGVTGVFLDQTPTSGSQQIGYYRTLDRYIHRLSPRAPIWINPGVYPDRRYMSVGSVVMVFEGPYANYLKLRVPRWARHYRPDRFAHTIYATPGGALGTAVRLSRARNVGFIFATDDVGSNPYRALPSYWPREQAAVATGCAVA